MHSVQQYLMLDVSAGGTSSEIRSASIVLMAVMACLHRSRDEDRPLLLSAAAPSIAWSDSHCRVGYTVGLSDTGFQRQRSVQVVQRRSQSIVT